MKLHEERTLCQDGKPLVNQALFVIGPRDLQAGNVSVRVHGIGNLGAKPKGEVIAEILAAIKERKP
ncbi:MAG: hypothetical protein WBW41_11845 [Verrucomicrobiia bacterium]